MSDGMEVESAAAASGTSSWTLRYGAKHRFERVRDFPVEIVPPKRVRIYRRSGHYLLQWWDPAARRNLAERIDGDLVVALVRARQIQERLTHFRTSGQPRAGGSRMQRWSTSTWWTVASGRMRATSALEVSTAIPAL
jgi:hypothetical protein